jgi:holo-[acyl-carrier protein] synthase
MIEVKRVKDGINKRKTFLKKIYVEQEVRFSERGKFRYEELAGRFAVKEAVLKALKTGWRKAITYRDIVVLNEPSGAPYVVLEGVARQVAKKLGVKKFFVSISHTKEYAVAMAIAVK